MANFDLLEKFNLGKTQSIVLLITVILVIIGFISTIYSFFTGLDAASVLVAVLELLIFLGLIIYGVYGYSKSDKYFKVIVGIFILLLLCFTVLNPSYWARLLALITLILLLLFVYKINDSKIAFPVIVIAFILRVISVIVAGEVNGYLLFNTLIISLSFVTIYWSRMKRELDE